jgi:molecular chaperone HscB
MDYFEVFGLPRLLGIDTATLEKTFHGLSRKYHPDYFTTAAAAEKTKAVRMTALLNDAYRTLRHPIRRVEYLLSLYGLKGDGSKVPKALLMEVFEINEQLEEVKSGRAEPKLKEQLSKLAEILSESSYIRNLERDLENPGGSKEH